LGLQTDLTTLTQALARLVFQIAKSRKSSKIMRLTTNALQ
jgi:hypothetical protein